MAGAARKITDRRKCEKSKRDNQRGESENNDTRATQRKYSARQLQDLKSPELGCERERETETEIGSRVLHNSHGDSDSDSTKHRTYLSGSPVSQGERYASGATNTNQTKYVWSIHVYLSPLA